MRYDNEYFVKRQTELDRSVKELEKTSGNYSLVRLAVFIAVAVLLVLGFYLKKEIIFVSIAALLFAVFIFLCVKHRKISSDLKLKSAVADINKEYIARVNGDFTNLKDKGNEFVVPDHDYCIDLDVFGEASLFALYNISESAIGRQAFKDELLNAHVDQRSTEELLERQKAIHEFSDKIEFIEYFQASERLGKLDKMPVALMALASNKSFAFSKTKRLVSKLLLLLWLIPFGLLFVSTKLFIPAALGVIFVNLIASFVMTSGYKECFSAVDGISR